MKLVCGLTCGVLLACVVFTQSLAYQARYGAALGSPLYVKHLFHRPHGVYYPWQGLEWAWRWGRQAPQAVKTAAGLALVPLLGGVVLAFVGHRGAGQVAHGRAGEPPPMTGHGTTVWATKRDIKKAGLF